MEEGQDSLSSDVCLFLPERKEGSSGVERGRESEDGDLFSPVRRRCCGLKIVQVVNEPGSENNGKSVPGATHEPKSEKQTQIVSEASTGRFSRALKNQCCREEEQDQQESRPSPNGRRE